MVDTRAIRPLPRRRIRAVGGIGDSRSIPPSPSLPSPVARRPSPSPPRRLPLVVEAEALEDPRYVLLHAGRACRRELGLREVEDVGALAARGQGGERSF